MQFYVLDLECQFCRAEFKCNNPRKRYCSEECCNKAYYARHREERLAYQAGYAKQRPGRVGCNEKPCKNCGKPFTGLSTTRFCTAECRAEGMRKRPCVECGKPTRRNGSAQRCKPCAELHVRASMYGITASRLRQMQYDSQGRCRICLNTTHDLVIDHCHRTGEVCGLICANCNTAIGMLKDDPMNAARALAYLSATRQLNLRDES